MRPSSFCPYSYKFATRLVFDVLPLAVSIICRWVCTVCPHSSVCMAASRRSFTASLAARLLAASLTLMPCSRNMSRLAKAFASRRLDRPLAGRVLAVLQCPCGQLQSTQYCQMLLCGSLAITAMSLLLANISPSKRQLSMEEDRSLTMGPNSTGGDRGHAPRR